MNRAGIDQHRNLEVTSLVKRQGTKIPIARRDGQPGMRTKQQCIANQIGRLRGTDGENTQPAHSDTSCELHEARARKSFCVELVRSTGFVKTRSLGWLTFVLIVSPFKLKIGCALRPGAPCLMSGSDFRPECGPRLWRGNDVIHYACLICTSCAT